MTPLEKEFEATMRERYRVEVYAETGYRPLRILEMIDTYGALETVRKLKSRYDDHASKGYIELYNHKRLDLSFEALMHDSYFASLFTKDELDWACKRLAQYQYTPPGGCKSRKKKSKLLHPLKKNFAPYQLRRMKGKNMARKVKTSKDYNTVFQITEIDKDKFVLLGVFTKKQLDILMEGLQNDYEERATGWRGQYQAPAKAIVKAYEGLGK